MKNAVTWLRIAFIIGTVADFFVAFNWLLIAFGMDVPNLLSGITGPTIEIHFLTYVNAMFMAGWGIILWWGYYDAENRRGLLPLTAALLLFSLISEPIIYSDLISERGSIVGMVARSALVVKFTAVYLNYEIKKRKLK